MDGVAMHGSLVIDDAIGRFSKTILPRRLAAFMTASAGDEAATSSSAISVSNHLVAVDAAMSALLMVDYHNFDRPTEHLAAKLRDRHSRCELAGPGR
jgi:hypothetical protein